MRPAAALALLASLAIAALLAQHVAGAAFVALLLFAVCLRAPSERRRLYLVGTLVSAGGVFVLTPFIETIGSHPIWTGPILPVLGQIDITTEEPSRRTRSCSTMTDFCRLLVSRAPQLLPRDSCRRSSAMPQASWRRFGGAASR